MDLTEDQKEAAAKLTEHFNRLMSQPLEATKPEVRQFCQDIENYIKHAPDGFEVIGYHVWQQHSSDTHGGIIETVDTETQALRKISDLANGICSQFYGKYQPGERATTTEIKTHGEILTVVVHPAYIPDWSVDFWFEEIVG